MIGQPYVIRKKMQGGKFFIQIKQLFLIQLETA